jgi:hypothetical protein
MGAFRVQSAVPGVVCNPSAIRSRDISQRGDLQKEAASIQSYKFLPFETVFVESSCEKFVADASKDWRGSLFL